MIRYSFFTLLFASCSHPGPPGIQQGFILARDGTEIHYSDYGSGETALVFVHCWCCDQGYWREQVEPFAKDYRVVTIDLAGHGKSGKGRKDYTLQTFGMDVAGVVQELGLDRVILIGHSMGGGVILAAAQHLKEQTLALIGVDTYQRFKYTFTDSMVRQFIQPFRDDFYHNTVRYVQGLFPPGSDSLLVMDIAEDMAQGPADVGVSAMINNFSEEPADLLEGLDVPIYSINSTMFPVDIETNREIYHDFEVRFMDGVGHFVQLEDPLTFNRQLRSILKEII
jgi:pimeloyl-ACP methyl ester carboxylesterase